MTTIGLAVLDDHRCLEVRILIDLTLRNAAAMRRGILSAWEERGRPGPLVLDLAGARHIDSSGLSALLEISQRIEDAGISLVIRGLRNGPRRMLQRTGLGKLFHIAGTGAPADAA
jgi:anti-anti-sigma factor